MTMIFEATGFNDFITHLTMSAYSKEKKVYLFLCLLLSHWLFFVFCFLLLWNV